jgi:hypothetical protein
MNISPKKLSLFNVQLSFVISKAERGGFDQSPPFSCLQVTDNAFPLMPTLPTLPRGIARYCPLAAKASGLTGLRGRPFAFRIRKPVKMVARRFLVGGVKILGPLLQRLSNDAVFASMPSHSFTHGLVVESFLMERICLAAHHGRCFSTPRDGSNSLF